MDCSRPARTRSEADSKSSASTYYFYFLTAKMAASLHKLAKSAPLNPKVNVAILFAYYAKVLAGDSLILER